MAWVKFKKFIIPVEPKKDYSQLGTGKCFYATKIRGFSASPASAVTHPPCVRGGMQSARIQREHAPVTAAVRTELLVIHAIDSGASRLWSNTRPVVEQFLQGYNLDNKSSIVLEG